MILLPLDEPGDSDKETYQAFERTAVELGLRVRVLVQRLQSVPRTQEVN